MARTVPRLCGDCLQRAPASTPWPRFGQIQPSALQSESGYITLPFDIFIVVVTLSTLQMGLPQVVDKSYLKIGQDFFPKPHLCHQLMGELSAKLSS